MEVTKMYPLADKWVKKCIYMYTHTHTQASQVVLVVKTPPANAGDIRDVDLITGSGSSPGGGHGNSLLYCLRNLMDREAYGLQSMGSQRVRHN